MLIISFSSKRSVWPTMVKIGNFTVFCVFKSFLKILRVEVLNMFEGFISNSESLLPLSGILLVISICF